MCSYSNRSEKVSRRSENGWTAWVGRSFVLFHMATVALVLIYGDSLTEISLFGAALQSLESDNGWSDSSIKFRDELRLIMPLTGIYSLAVWLTVFVSSMILRDIAPSGPGSAGPGTKIVFGSAMVLVWFFGFGGDQPVGSWSDLTSVETAFFNYWPGILMSSTVMVLLARQVGEDSTRFLINRLSQGGEDSERSR